MRDKIHTFVVHYFHERVRYAYVKAKNNIFNWFFIIIISEKSSEESSRRITIVTFGNQIIRARKHFVIRKTDLLPSEINVLPISQICPSSKVVSNLCYHQLWRHHFGQRIIAQKNIFISWLSSPVQTAVSNRIIIMLYYFNHDHLNLKMRT